MAYKADIIKYYPEFLQENLEFQAICDAVNPEFDLLYQRMNQLMDNILPQTTDEHGIEKYEEWLGIFADPSVSLEERQAQVIAKLNETLPYTEIRLQRILAAIVGWGNFHYERNGAFVKVELTEEAINQSPVVYKTLQKILPLNLHFELNCISDIAETELSFGIGTIITETIVTPIDKTEHIANVFTSGANRLKRIFITEIDHSNETTQAQIGVAGRTVETIITKIDET